MWVVVGVSKGNIIWLIWEYGWINMVGVLCVK